MFKCTSALSRLKHVALLLGTNNVLYVLIFSSLSTVFLSPAKHMQAYGRVNYRIALSPHTMATFHSCVQPGDFMRDAAESDHHGEEVGMLQWRTTVSDCSSLFRPACAKAREARLCVGGFLCLDGATSEGICEEVLSYMFYPAVPLLDPADWVRLIAARYTYPECAYRT